MIDHTYTRFVSEKDVIEIHDKAIATLGGLAGVRDVNLLISAVNQPLMMIDYGNAEDRQMHSLAGAYFFHIIKNHPFADGNKRTGLLTALEFFSRNGFELEIEFDILYQLAIATAASQINKKEIARFLQQEIKPI